MKKMLFFTLGLFLALSMTSRVNQMKLRENFHRINSLETENGLLLAEVDSNRKMILLLTTGKEIENLVQNRLNMKKTSKVIYARCEQGESNLIFAYTQKI